MSGSLGEFGEGAELHIHVLEHRSDIYGSWSLREEEIVRIKTSLKLTKIPRGFELPLAMGRDLKPISFRFQGAGKYSGYSMQSWLVRIGRSRCDGCILEKK